MHTFSTPVPITATLDIPAGRVQFIADGQDTTTVEIGPADVAKGRDVKLAGQTSAEYSDGVLRIAATAGNRILGSSGAVQVRVHLPAGSRVEAKAASTELRTTGRLADVSLESARATVEVEEAATARLATVDGDITVARLGGDADIRTARGGIQVGEATGGTLVLHSVTGAISVGAAAGVSASLDAGTTSGRIRNALKNTGTADLAIHATTTLGDISARSL
jgi:DUF4097 and DUF4098 domain-containing protein YvlB